MVKLGLGLNQKLIKLRNRLLSWRYAHTSAKAYAKSYRYQNVVCALVRNEEDILQEWVLFHLAVGIEYFLLWDDHSTDNSRKVLKPYENAGLVEWRDFEFEKYTVPRQLHTYNRSIRLLQYKAQWVWFLDSDEFLVPAKSDTIKELMSTLAQDPITGAVAVNWLFFGTAGVEDIKQDEWYIEKLTQRAPLDWKNHRHCKCAVRPEATAAFVTQPHYPVLYGSKSFVSANKNPYYEGLIDFDFLKLHHYWHRTEKFYRNEKIPRKEEMSGIVRTEKERALHHQMHNKVHDDSIIRFLPKMREIQRHILKISTMR